MSNFLFLFIFIGLFAFTNIHSQDSFDDLKNVKKTIGYYFDGATNAKIDQLEKAFHTVCVLRWVVDGKLAERPRDNWFAKIKSGGPSERANEIESISITGNAASVKVMCDLPHAQYVDYISLLKIEGEWKIVAKIFEVIHK